MIVVEVKRGCIESNSEQSAAYVFTHSAVGSALQDEAHPSMLDAGKCGSGAPHFSDSNGVPCAPVHRHRGTHARQLRLQLSVTEVID